MNEDKRVIAVEGTDPGGLAKSIAKAMNQKPEERIVIPEGTPPERIAKSIAQTAAMAIGSSVHQLVQAGCPEPRLITVLVDGLAEVSLSKRASLRGSWDKLVRLHRKIIERDRQEHPDETPAPENASAVVVDKPKLPPLPPIETTPKVRRQIALRVLADCQSNAERLGIFAAIAATFCIRCGNVAGEHECKGVAPSA